MAKSKPFWELGLNPITMTKYISVESEMAARELKKQLKRKKRGPWNQLQ